MVATVARNGAGFTTSNIRTYDVWGGVRTGATTGGPKGRYVANLVHVQDDESGLIYMRARYYEPETGRFISEDPAMDGSNWYLYANNDLANKVDFNGKNSIDSGDAVAIISLILEEFGVDPPQWFAVADIIFSLVATLLLCGKLGVLACEIGITAGSNALIALCTPGLHIVGLVLGIFSVLCIGLALASAFVSATAIWNARNEIELRLLYFE